MKTNQLKNSPGKYNTSRTSLLTISSVLLFMVCFCSNVHSQVNYSKTKVGVGVDTYLGGNLLGTLYTPYITLSKGGNTFFGGPVIQKRSMIMSGLKAGYSRNITGGDPNGVDCDGDNVDQLIYLNVFAGFQYTKGLSLSYKNQIIEERGSLIRDYDWNKYKVSTIELSAGIECNLRLSNRITWKNYAGFNLCNQKNYMKGMWNDKVNAGLILGTGITFNILN